MAAARLIALDRRDHRRGSVKKRPFSAFWSDCSGQTLLCSPDFVSDVDAGEWISSARSIMISSGIAERVLHRANPWLRGRRKRLGAYRCGLGRTTQRLAFFPSTAPRPQMQTFDEHSECPFLASSVASLSELNTRLLSRADSHKTSACGCCALTLNVVQFQFQTGTAHASIVSNRVAASYLAPL